MDDPDIHLCAPKEAVRNVLMARFRRRSEGVSPDRSRQDSGDLVNLLPLACLHDQRLVLGCTLHDPATSSAAALRAPTTLLFLSYGSGRPTGGRRTPCHILHPLVLKLKGRFLGGVDDDDLGPKLLAHRENHSKPKRNLRSLCVITKRPTSPRQMRFTSARKPFWWSLSPEPTS